jgi:hypothetical protein
MLRGCGRFRKSSYTSIRPTLDDGGAVLETKWRAWVEQESFTRYVLTIQTGRGSADSYGLFAVKAGIPSLFPL